MFFSPKESKRYFLGREIHVTYLFLSYVHYLKQKYIPIEELDLTLIL